jgi:hypothetical protein
MGLRDIAAADAKLIAEDVAGGFGCDFLLVDPDGRQVALKGLDQDIAAFIDPETGVGVSGRMASMVVPMKAMEEAGIALPRGVADEGSSVWMVFATNVLGKQRKWKVAEVRPDATIGLTTLLLEVMR